MIQLALHLGLVRLIDQPIGVSIASEEAKRDVAIWQAVAIDVLHTQNDISALVTPVTCAVRLLPLKEIDPTVAVPLTTRTWPEVTGASNVKTAL